MGTTSGRAWVSLKTLRAAQTHDQAMSPGSPSAPPAHQLNSSHCQHDNNLPRHVDAHVVPASHHHLTNSPGNLLQAARRSAPCSRPAPRRGRIMRAVVGERGLNQGMGVRRGDVGAPIFPTPSPSSGEEMEREIVFKVAMPSVAYNLPRRRRRHPAACCSRRLERSPAWFSRPPQVAHAPEPRIRRRHRGMRPTKHGAHRHRGRRRAWICPHEVMNR